MKKIEVLGTGCKKCVTTAEQIESVAGKLGIEIEVEKVTDPAAIMGYKVMSTPAVAIDGKLVHSGSVPDSGKIEAMLKA
ncbi:thioredoxin family protein [Vreelandella andesensis]|uniref:Thioredoxin family protein n=1 Tax=Vreelandella andesensis TaxID=447567 RepID=A0A3S0WBP6_9GAMM|nr:thioredoxin family protein [Halomonas andesensis]RUR33918.1 thioredoxin family protein [Halomonas andesensis]